MQAKSKIFGYPLTKTLFVTIILILTTIILLTNCSIILAQNDVTEYSFTMKWGSNGTGDGQFLRPHGIDFDSKGNVYVTDRDLNNIQKFTADGQFLMKWGTKGAGEGEFKTPYSILIDKFDKVYVVDRDNDRFQKFDINGTFLELWNKFDLPISNFITTKTSTPYQYAPFLTVTGSSFLDVPNNASLQLTQFTTAVRFKISADVLPSNFAFIVNKGGFGSDSAGLNVNHGLWLTSSEQLEGGFETTEGTNNFVKSESTFNDGKWHHGAVTYDGSTVRLYADGEEIESLDTTSIPDNTGTQPLRIGANSQSASNFFGANIDEVGIWNRALSETEILDLMNNGIFASTGLIYSNSFNADDYEPSSTLTDSIKRPEAMAISPAGDIYITDTGNNRTLRLDDNFNFILAWGSTGTKEGQFSHPHGIGVDTSGNVYVNELNLPRIQKFDGNGNFIRQWGSEGTGPGQFDLGLEHLFVDDFDNVWQVDGTDNPRVQKFDSNGTYITSVGSGPCIIPDEVKNDIKQMISYGECDAQLHRPEHANVNSSGDLYVVDRGNQRIEVFSPQK